MSMNKTDFFFTSTTGDCEIHAARYEGINKKAIFQITHGMAEYIDRYEDFIEALVNDGFVVYAHDHIGHGKSINDNYPLGYFGLDNAEGNIFVKDCKKLTDIAKSENPGLPVFFFGHSMGSFVARKYISLYGEDLAGAVICGTGGPNPAAGIAIALANAFIKIKGAKAPGTVINNVAFGSYNNKTDKRTGFDWLTNKESIVDKYIADPLCGFCFSYQGFKDMLQMLKYINSKPCYNQTPANLPIFLIAGEQDPVGSYGKGVETVAAEYKKGHNNVTLKLYPNDRHELLNELDKETVKADVINWCNNLLGK
ncbi:MAG: lysophospholipase [Oscillospiraceae bacterium]|nr:lysophospholipase [Candidatus Limimonas egerieequi]